MGYKPLDAYIGVLCAGGAISCSIDLLQRPSSVPVLVVEFCDEARFFCGIFHSDLDAWEIQEDGKPPEVVGLAGRGTPAFDCCEIVAANFDDHFGLPKNGTLIEKMTREVMAAFLATKPDHAVITAKQRPAEVSLQPQIGVKRLKANWTVDKEQDLRAAYHLSPIASKRFTVQLPLVSDIEARYASRQSG